MALTRPRAPLVPNATPLLSIASAIETLRANMMRNLYYASATRAHRPDPICDSPRILGTDRYKSAPHEPRRANCVAIRSAQGFDIHGDLDAVRTAPQHDAFQWTHVAEIATPADSDVASRRHDRVGRVEVEPTKARDIYRCPSVRCVCAHEPRPIDRRIGFQVAGNVACSEPERAQGADRDVREVLAHSALVA